MPCKMPTVMQNVKSHVKWPAKWQTAFNRACDCPLVENLVDIGEKVSPSKDGDLLAGITDALDNADKGNNGNAWGRDGKSPPQQVPRGKRQVPSLSRLLKPSAAIRKEYRMMSDSERKAYHDAMNAVKTDIVDGMSKYDILIVYHTPEYAPGAHFGPALLPFHRELVKQLELVLRTVNPQVGVPYWDSTLEELLPDPTHSVIWTEEFFGNPNGDVTTGPYKNWVTAQDETMDHLSAKKRIVRDVGRSQYGGIYRQEDIDITMGTTDFKQLTYCVDPRFELVHGTLHMYIGGHMATLRISPNDPTFFQLHSYVDYMWEMWRQKHQTPSQRESQYTANGDQSCNSFHRKDETMKPFKITNGDGLKNDYTGASGVYNYEESPKCSRNLPDCGSKYLFCYTSAPGGPRCVSKVRTDGNCTGFENWDICQEGSTCASGRCKRGVATTTTTTTRRTTTTTRAPTTTTTRRANTPARRDTTTTTRQPITNTVTFKAKAETPTPAPTITEIDENSVLDESQYVYFPITVLSARGGRIAPFTDGQIVTEHEGGLVATGTFAPAGDPNRATGWAVARALNPFTRTSRRVDFSVKVLDDNSRPCAPMCLHETAPTSPSVRQWTYHGCLPEVTLTNNPRTSDKIPFTPLEDQVNALRFAKGGRIPQPDPFMFLCHAQNRFTTRETPGPTEVPSSRKVDAKVTPEARPDDCTNTHRCCSIWASDSAECVASSWMRVACRKACRICKHKPTESELQSQRSDVKDGVVATGPRIGTHIFFDTPTGGTQNTCVDHYAPHCTKWATRGECSKNSDWMLENCQKSCQACDSGSQLERMCGVVNAGAGSCRDSEIQCKSWAAGGECGRNPWWMGRNCAKSCGKC